MNVTSIEKVSSNSNKVYVDGEFAFILSKSELSRLNIMEGLELDQMFLDAVEEEIVKKKAKKYVLYLLEQMDRSKEQLREKLKYKYYKDHVIEEALAYAQSFGYIDDTRLATNFINSRKESKSKKEIYQLLVQKKLSKDIIDAAFEEMYEEKDEIHAISHIASKKGYTFEGKDYKEKQKIVAYFVRKGFSYDKVYHVLQVEEIS